MTPTLDHIAFLVDDLDAAIGFYGATLGLGEPLRVDLPELRLRLAFFHDPSGVPIELVETRGRTELRHGDPVLALAVDDLDAAIARYTERGMRVFHQPPTERLPFARGWVSKADGHGTVIELCPKGALRDFLERLGNSSIDASAS